MCGQAPFIVVYGNRYLEAGLLESERQSPCPAEEVYCHRLVEPFHPGAPAVLAWRVRVRDQRQVV